MTVTKEQKELRGVLHTLAQVRQKKEEVERQKEEHYNAMLRTPAGRLFLEADLFLHHVKNAMADADARARELALAEYAVDGNKSVAEGVSIRVTRKMVYDEAAALAWCATNAPVLILRALDKKGFEKLAPTEVVTVQEVPQVAISTVLAPYLAEGEDEEDD